MALLSFLTIAQENFLVILKKNWIFIFLHLIQEVLPWSMYRTRGHTKLFRNGMPTIDFRKREQFSFILFLTIACLAIIPLIITLLNRRLSRF